MPADTLLWNALACLHTEPIHIQHPLNKQPAAHQIILFHNACMVRRFLKKEMHQNLHWLLLSTIVADSHLMLSPTSVVPIYSNRRYRERHLRAYFPSLQLIQLNSVSFICTHCTLHLQKQQPVHKYSGKQNSKQAASWAISNTYKNACLVLTIPNPFTPTGSSVYVSTVPRPYRIFLCRLYQHKSNKAD